MEISSLTNNSSTQGWHCRGFLPHFDGGAIPQSITFRLANSFPASLLAQWNAELEMLPADKREFERRYRIEEYLDKGIGPTWLASPDIAEIVKKSLLFFNDKRYQLHAWVIMPNHVHILLTPYKNNSLSQILHAWKSFTSKRANAFLHRKGAFWQNEYFDRFIRDEQHFESAIFYIENNPVKACLCKDASQWPYSSATGRVSSF